MDKSPQITLNHDESQLAQSLHIQYGELIGGTDLMKCLGFKTMAAFNRSYRLGYLGIRLIEIPNRRGKFALTSDVINWLNSLSKGTTP